MDFRIIKAPSQSTKAILKRRMGPNSETILQGTEAIGFVQGRLIEMICAVDIAEKTAGVIVEDIRGTCPQHIVMIAIFGDTASVESAIERIQQNVKEGVY